MDEDEYEKIIAKVLNTDVEMAKIEQTYYKKFHTILTWKKVFAVRMALNKFKMEALNQFQPAPTRNNRTFIPQWIPNKRP